MTGPNLEEIEMSLDMHYLTEIVITDKPRDGIVNTWSRGRSKPGVSPYSRPMIQIMETTSAEHRAVENQVPCASCGDFSRSWNCEAHTYWAPVDDTRNLPAPLERDIFRTAFPDGPVMRNIQAVIAESAGRLPAELMPSGDLMITLDPGEAGFDETD